MSRKARPRQGKKPSGKAESEARYREYVDVALQQLNEMNEIMDDAYKSYVSHMAVAGKILKELEREYTKQRNKVA